MTSVQFYHLTATPLERALPKLLEKSYAGGFKALVVTQSDEQAERINQLLWTYDPNSFLPHGSIKEGQIEHQPILISSSIEAGFPANLLVITDGQTPPEPAKFDRILDIFDGQDPQAVENARTRWKDYKNKNIDVSYFKQNAQGGWQTT